MFFDPSKPFDEKHIRQMFEEGVLPVLKEHGAEIGEKAMQGDKLAEEVIRRYHIYSIWLDPVNLAMLENKVRHWLKLKEH